MPVRVWQFDWLYREPWLLGFPFRIGLFTLDLVLMFVVLGLVLPYFFGPRPYCKLVCETGYLFEVDAASELVDRLDHYARHPELVRQHGVAAKARAVELTTHEFSNR